MNFALPSIVVLFFVLPGFVARRSYLALPLPDSKLTAEIAWAVIPASLFHLVGISLCQLVTPYRVDFATIGFLLAGTHEDVANARAFKELGRYLWPIVFYNAVLLPSSGSIVYFGIMQSFIYSSDGNIEAVVFESAQKWMRPGALAPIVIPGAAFAVKFSEILNLNVSHYRLEQ